MINSDRSGQYAAEEQELLAQLDGVERAPFVPLAWLVAVSPGTSVEEPPYVWVEWSPGLVERPYPGSAVWRVALQHYLLRPTIGDPAAHLLRPIIAACLERFPTLESWMRLRAAATPHPPRVAR